ncbi:MAG TPA: thioredoxin family protein [Planctomycetota bacterium]|nr:thioredoxin family protein [Planctomycetota bacterium]
MGFRHASLLLLAATLALPALPGEKAQRVEEAYPGLVPGSLACAVMAELPEGVLLKSGAIQVTAKELADELDKAPEMLRAELKKNAPVVLEQMATGRLLLEAARKSAAEKKVDVSKKSDADLIEDYFGSVAGEVRLAEGEAKEFYDKNGAICGDTPFEKMKEELEAYVLQQKKEAVVQAHIRTLGRRMDIAVSAAWLKEQAPLVRDNPVDKARFGGKPTLVDFGAAGCCGPDKMQPVIEAVGEKYKGKLAVLYVEAKTSPILAARCGVNSIPTQIIFDKDGKEIFRHDGLMSEKEIVEQLRAVGVR